MSHEHAHNQRHGHGHTHGPIDPSIKRSRAGVRAVLLSLAVLGLTALAQMRSERAERIAGYFVVLAIFVSACVAGYEAIVRLINPEEVDRLGVLGRGRQRRRGLPRPTGGRPADRAWDNARDPQDHLGFLADGAPGTHHPTT